MIKKLGVVTVGVAASLLAAAPLASATECHDEHEHHEPEAGSDCDVTGGSAEANGGISGDALLGNGLVQAPIGGANLLNISCNEILNDNLSGNSVSVDIL
ncbi:hypothetical protein [Actinomycetospora straminea]|uniref:Small secreted domain DUF320 n=1 Tax=Actinomycetospora straminea TaxID=663607 RepID=A0ABP9F1H1_9PSEU|nr:hypothetical protein [Actinomycetospora straminea]MDD7935745.1 hypothetical protein [Actinomycetospora straminea]